LAEKHAGTAAIHTLELDITGEEAPRTLVAAAVETLGGIDVLFNNAGVSSHAPAEQMSDAEWDRTFAVNLRAMFRICREAIPALRQAAEKKGRARIVNTASVMAFDTDYGLAAYTASKHGVAGLTKTLALELGKSGITANYVLPGAIY